MFPVGIVQTAALMHCLKVTACSLIPAEIPDYYAYAVVMPAHQHLRGDIRTQASTAYNFHQGSCLGCLFGGCTPQLHITNTAIITKS